MVEQTVVTPPVARASTGEPEPPIEQSHPRSGGPLTLIPGLVLLAAIGLLGRAAETGVTALGKAAHVPMPTIEYVLWAIIIGAIIANTIGVHPIFRAGVETYEFWLKVGIVLLGARFVLGDVAKLGGTALIQILVDMTVAGAIILSVSRAMGLSGKLGSLLAIGTSICGVSAIIAGKGAIKAKDSEVTYAIAAILALGAVSLFLLPVIGHGLRMSDFEFGMWAGLAVDNTAETTATGYLFSAEAGRIAVLVKSCRNALIGFVVLGFAIYWASRGEADQVPAGFVGKTGFLWRMFPKFVLGFLVVSTLATVGALSKTQITSLGNLSRWAFLLTFAGVGLKLNVRELSRAGWRPLVVAVAGLAAVATVSLGLVMFTSRVLGWGN